MSAKTAPFVDRRDARTTEDEMAAFMERTEDSLSKQGFSRLSIPLFEITVASPFLVPAQLPGRAVVGQQCIEDEQAR